MKKILFKITTFLIFCILIISLIIDSNKFENSNLAIDNNLQTDTIYERTLFPATEQNLIPNPVEIMPYYDETYPILKLNTAAYKEDE